jgi:hypothetical protein
LGLSPGGLPQRSRGCYFTPKTIASYVTRCGKQDPRGRLVQPENPYPSRQVTLAVCLSLGIGLRGSSHTWASLPESSLKDLVVATLLALDWVCLWPVMRWMRCILASRKSSELPIESRFLGCLVRIWTPLKELGWSTWVACKFVPVWSEIIPVRGEVIHLVAAAPIRARYSLVWKGKLFQIRALLPDRSSLDRQHMRETRIASFSALSREGFTFARVLSLLLGLGL